MKFIIKLNDNLFDLEISTENKTIFFIQKKRYMIFDDLSQVKIKGIRINKDKYIRNQVFRLYNKDNNFNKSFPIPTTIYKSYYLEAKKIMDRLIKLKKILNS